MTIEMLSHPSRGGDSCAAPPARVQPEHGSEDPGKAVIAPLVGEPAQQRVRSSG
jgi:hypothetical protein